MISSVKSVRKQNEQRLEDLKTKVDNSLVINHQRFYK